MSRMSVTPLRNISVRSIPIPNANPWYRSGSIPAARSTFGLTIPQPPHSIQPRSASRPRENRRSSSALGSVNGKNAGRQRVSTASPNMARAKWSSVPLRWAMVRPSSMAMPSSWWNTGVCVASSSSVRKTLPGQTT